MKSFYSPGLCDQNAFCEICGTMGALRMGDHLICESCYYDYESCCLEFAGNDLTQPVSEQKVA